MIVEPAAIFVILAGLLFFIGAVVGLVRFPDFYTRMHAAGKGDTLSTMLILSGLALYLFHDGFSLLKTLVALKILAICVFIMLTSPTSTHALMQAGYEDDIKPWGTGDDDGGRDRDGGAPEGGAPSRRGAGTGEAEEVEP